MTYPAIKASLAFTFALTFLTTTGSAQITAPRVLSTQIDPIARLNEQLINRLRATTDAQIAYLENVVRLVKEDRLELRLVVAIERYAIRRNAHYPFPFFERALKFEAAKRGVALPSIRLYQSTAIPKAR